MEKIEIITCNFTKHDKEDTVDRPNGSAEWIILCFMTPFEIYTKDGFVKGDIGDIIIQTPYYPEMHRADPNSAVGFANHWLYCTGDMQSLVEKYAIPVNTLIKTNDYHNISTYFTKITNELILHQSFCQDKIRLILEEMLIEIKRYKDNYDLKVFYCTSHIKKMQEIREDILNNYVKTQSLELLSKKAGLSVSRFCAVYKHTFGISAIDDLIRIRMQRARELLISTNHPISEIASMCGFESLYYFSKKFKEKNGVSPTNFRK